MIAGGGIKDLELHDIAAQPGVVEIVATLGVDLYVGDDGAGDRHEERHTVRIGHCAHWHEGDGAGDFLDESAILLPAPLIAAGIAVERIGFAKDEIHGNARQVKRHGPFAPPNVNINGE